MKRIAVFCLIGIVLLLGSCASMKLENYSSEGENVLFRTDFSTLDDRFMIASPGKTVEIDQGALHLVGEPEGEPAHVELAEPFGNNSVTSLKLKLSKARPEAFINFMASEEGRLAFIFRDENFHVFADHNGKNVYDALMDYRGMATEEWKDITVAIVDYDVLLFFSGRLAKKFELPDDFHSQGMLNFECHDEYWVDDLVIKKVSSFQFVKPN